MGLHGCILGGGLGKKALSGEGSDIGEKRNPME